jgi:hypothetical protein
MPMHGKYPNAKGQKKVKNAKGDPGRLPKKDRGAVVEFCGISDSRPEVTDVRQSAK